MRTPDHGQIEVRGAAVAAWRDRLPAIVAGFEKRWSLTVGPPFPELSHNYVAPALRADGTPAVLKLSFPNNPGLATEARALSTFCGRGAVWIFELDLERGAMLLERLKPGTPLAAVRDDAEATSIAAGVMRRLWRPVPEDHPFPPVSEWAQGFARLRRRFGGGTGSLPPVLVEEAEALFAELVGSQTRTVLLHGDLHHSNILASHRSWLAVDPKGVVGEPAYDTGALLRNPVGLLHESQPAKRLERRLDQLSEELDLDRARVRGWGLAQAVLAAYWGWEDTGRVWQEALAFAELLARTSA